MDALVNVIIFMWQSVLVLLVVFALLGLGMHDDLDSERKRFVRWLGSWRRETPLLRAQRTRRERLEQYEVEYLTLGFDEEQASKKAADRMQTEARAAEAVKP